MAGLPVERRLLVAGDARHRHAAAELGRLAVHVRARERLGQRLGRHAEHVAQLGVPRAACGCRTGACATRSSSRSTWRPVSLLHEPRVDRAEGGARVDAALLQQPLDLRAGEVRVEHEPGALAEERLAALRLQLVAARRGAPVLPDERVVQRLAGVGIPGDDRLALVRDADPGEVGAADAGVRERLLRHAARDVPDLGRVVLDPARPREVLLELAVGAAARAALARRRRCRSCPSCPGRSRGSRRGILQLLVSRRVERGTT